jgi:hypothetical protein
VKEKRYKLLHSASLKIKLSMVDIMAVAGITELMWILAVPAPQQKYRPDSTFSDDNLRKPSNSALKKNVVLRDLRAKYKY